MAIVGWLIAAGDKAKHLVATIERIGYKSGFNTVILVSPHRLVNIVDNG